MSIDPKCYLTHKTVADVFMMTYVKKNWKKSKNVSSEQDRWVVETRLSKLRDIIRQTHSLGVLMLCSVKKGLPSVFGSFLSLVELWVGKI